MFNNCLYKSPSTYNYISYYMIYNNWYSENKCYCWEQGNSTLVRIGPAINFQYFFKDPEKNLTDGLFQHLYNMSKILIIRKKT